MVVKRVASAFPTPPSGSVWSWDVDQWTPFATINAVAADGPDNAGWAVDNVRFAGRACFP
jgi:hypothetical protein